MVGTKNVYHNEMPTKIQSTGFSGAEVSNYFFDAKKISLEIKAIHIVIFSTLITKLLKRKVFNYF